MIIYARHARERMEARYIKKGWVEEIIRNPDKRIPARYGKKQAIKKMNGEEISVIYAEEEDHHIVITVFWGR